MLSLRRRASRGGLPLRLLAFALGAGLLACGPTPKPADPAPSYCGVAPIVGARCGSCHSAEPQFGAPMSLMHASDFNAPATSSAGEPVWKAAQRRLHDAYRPMPPSGVLPDEELAALDRWIAGGRSPGDCPDTPVSTRFILPGVEGLPCTPDLYVTASRVGTDVETRTTDGYPVPVVNDEYRCFAVRAPAEAGRLVTAMSPLIGDGRVLHHMILYEDTKKRLPNGPHACGDRSTEAVPVMLWGPGAGGMVLPGDVGLTLGDHEIQFDLEVHYNNSRHLDDVVDTSGFALCTTNVPRTHIAAVGTLGTTSFTIPAATEAGPGTLSLSNTCEPTITEPTRILATAPHMHGAGTSMKTVIIRAYDEDETLIDVPNFDFNNQIAYPVDVTLGPYDKLVTTCTWTNPRHQPVRYGSYTDDEMCFNFLLYYPAGQIAIPGLPAEACVDPVEILSHENP